MIRDFLVNFGKRFFIAVGNVLMGMLVIGVFFLGLYIAMKFVWPIVIFLIAFIGLAFYLLGKSITGWWRN